MARWGLAVVDGASMLPTLRPGDRLLVRYGGGLAPGRLAIVRLPARPIGVKRLGDRDADGWWIARDNPADGVDSTTFGRLPDEAIPAIVLCRIWPRPSLLRHPWTSDPEPG